MRRVLQTTAKQEKRVLVATINVLVNFFEARSESYFLSLNLAHHNSILSPYSVMDVWGGHFDISKLFSCNRHLLALPILTGGLSSFFFLVHRQLPKCAHSCTSGAGVHSSEAKRWDIQYHL